MTQTERPAPSEARMGSVTARASRDVVHIHAQFYGRGPTHAKALWRDDCLVVVLEQIFTKAEELLVAGGHFEQVRTQRQTFQDEVEPLFRQAIEAATGCPVRAFFSQVSKEGIAAEVFLLEGESEECLG